MKALLLAALFLLAPVAHADSLNADSVPGCHGVVLDDEFTGACVHSCYGGTAYIEGRWFASWPCTF